MMADEIVESLVARLYAAFNDPGFLGMGGTDEQGVLNALSEAKRKNLMKEVDKSYNEKYQAKELSLKDELDDELSGDDFTRAMELYNGGLKDEADNVHAKTVPLKNAKRIAGTVTPSNAALGRKAKQNEKDLQALRASVGFDHLPVDQKNDVLAMAASYPELVPDLPSLLETDSYVTLHWNGKVISAETPQGREIRIQFMHIAGVFAVWLKNAADKGPGAPTGASGAPPSLQEKILRNTLRAMVSGKVKYAFYSEKDDLMASWDGLRTNVNFANVPIPTDTKRIPPQGGRIIDAVSHEMSHYTNGTHRGKMQHGTCENFLDELSARIVGRYAELGSVPTRADIATGALEILNYPAFKDMRLDKTDDDADNPEKKMIRDRLAEMYGVPANRITRSGDVTPELTSPEWLEPARRCDELFVEWDFDNNPDNLENS